MRWRTRETAFSWMAQSKLNLMSSAVTGEPSWNMASSRMVYSQPMLSSVSSHLMTTPLSVNCRFLSELIIRSCMGYHQIPLSPEMYLEL